MKTNGIICGTICGKDLSANKNILGSLLNPTPLAPTLLSATVFSDSVINLAWTVNDTIQDGHRIYISTNGTDFTEKGTVSGLTATYSATGLTANTLYYFKVVAYKGTTESDPSNTDSDYTNTIIAFAGLSDGALPTPLTGATWAIASGKAVNTPTEGNDILTDGGLENWTTATNLTSWGENVPSGGAIEQEGTVKRTGNYAAKITVNSSGTRTEISQAPTVTLNEFYNSRCWVRASAADKIFRLNYDNQTNLGLFIPTTTEFTEAITSHVKRTASGSLFFQSIGNNNTIFYLDDCSLKQLTKTTLYATIDAKKSDVTTKSYWVKIKNTLSGVIMNLDSVTNPLNWVMLVTNGASNSAYLMKSVNGTISQAALFGELNALDSQLIELRKSGNTYSFYLNGVKIGADQTISDASIVSNTIHGIFSTYSGNTCERFFCGEGADIIDVPDGATISDYYKYVSSGDILRLAVDGTYTFSAGVSGFSTLPNGTAERRTVIDGRGSTITGGSSGIYLGTAKNYFTFNDLTLANQTNTGVLLGTNLTTGASYITFNSVKAYSNQGTYLDTFKNQYQCHHLEFNYCEAGPCSGADKVDGFEDWDSEDVVYNNCIAHGFLNGAELYNNGHGFETYAQNAGEICKRITYNNCHAYDCRVGFSCEGGPLAAAHEDVKAINCTTATCSIADAGGVDGATLLVTAGTLLNRTGSVTEI